MSTLIPSHHTYVTGRSVGEKAASFPIRWQKGVVGRRLIRPKELLMGPLEGSKKC